MKELVNILKGYNIEHGNIEEKRLADYMDGILQWNEKINLTAVTNRAEFVDKHFADSLSCIFLKEFHEAQKIVDVGTGAGFPGVPLAILFPEKKFVLMDSLKKRLKVIEALCNELGIDNVSVLHMRAEDAGKNKTYRESYDLCVSRAVANMTSLCELCLPLVRREGAFIAYKSKSALAEIKESEKAIGILGGGLPVIFSPENLRDGNDHILCIVKKIKNTPVKYPRRAGMPVSNPIK